VLPGNIVAFTVVTDKFVDSAGFSGKKNAPLQAMGRLNKPTFIGGSATTLA